MIDLLGFNTKFNNSLTVNFEYKKTIGVDILLGINKVMRFDIEFSCKFRPDNIKDNSDSTFISKLIDSGSATPKIV